MKAVYLLGSGHPVKLTAEVLDLDEQTVRQYFLDYTKQDKKNRSKRQWVQLHYTGKEPSLTNEQEQEIINHLDENLYQRSQDIFLYIKKRYKVHYLWLDSKRNRERIKDEQRSCAGPVYLPCFTQFDNINFHQKMKIGVNAYDDSNLPKFKFFFLRQVYRES